MLDLDRVERFLTKLPIRDRVTQRTIPFKINKGQRVLHDALKEQQQEKRPMRAVILKSRRRGISSYTDALLACHCMSRSGTNSLIVTHKFRSSEALFSTPKTMLSEKLPGQIPLKDQLLLPPMTQHKIVFPHADGDSQLTIATAGNVEGGRGASYTDLHLSEVGFYTSAAAFTALLPTVPRDPDTIVIMESTANGRVYDGEPFYKFWQATVEGQTDFIPVFLGWLQDAICVDFNRNVDDAPIDDDERVLMKEFGARPEQIAWRRTMMESPEIRGYAQLFDQEYPYCPEVAFISTGDPAFTREEMAIARSTIQKPETRGILHMNGTTPVFEESSNGELHIWEKPNPRARYYVGADAARGTETGDFAACVVLNGDTGEYAARYVGHVGPHALAYLLAAVGYWYNRAMVNVELTGNLGLWTQKVLRDDIRYPSLYRWKGSRDDKVGGKMGKGGSIGWETTMRSREMAMTAFREAIKWKMIFIRDEMLLSQMDMCTRKDSWARWEIEKGHDDLLMAGLIANITRAQWHPRQFSQSGTTYSEQTKLPDKVKHDRTAATLDDVITMQCVDQYNSTMAAVRRGDRQLTAQQMRLMGI